MSASACIQREGKVEGDGQTEKFHQAVCEHGSIVLKDDSSRPEVLRGLRLDDDIENITWKNCNNRHKVTG